MSLVVNTNLAALNSQRNLGINNSNLSKSLERLSSGLRINKAADDAAGLSIATKFDAQVKGMNQAVRNANNAISLVQTAEGGINNLTNILQRMRELAVQSSSDDNTPSDRATLTSEANNLIAEFTRISNTTEFNTMTLLDGTFTSKNFQVGANYAQAITFNIGDARGKAVGGRSQADNNIADGVLTSTDGNFGGSEFKINGTGVQATNATDDQYSVLDMSSGVVNVAMFSALAQSVGLVINGTTVVVSASQTLVGSGASANADQFAALIVSVINTASITGIKAVQGISDQNSTWTLEATGGTKVELEFSGGSLPTFASMVGFANVSAMFGSTASVTTNYNGESSAIAKSVAINAIKSTTQVTATARANTITASSAIQASTIASGGLYINGVNIGQVTTIANDGNGALVTAINNVSSQTGVTATTSGGALQLTASDGRNITVTVATSSIATSTLGINSAYLTNNTAVFRSTVRLTSNSEITLSGNLGDLENAGTSAADQNTKSTTVGQSVAVDLNTYNVSKIQMDTQDNAQSAILTIDAAMGNINLLRSQIGAIQNRLEFTVANLQVASENMSASESRIKDADFAYETTQFTRNQILVQAGTAMLAQSNQLQQVALQLLK